MPGPLLSSPDAEKRDMHDPEGRDRLQTGFWLAHGGLTMAYRGEQPTSLAPNVRSRPLRHDRQPDHQVTAYMTMVNTACAQGPRKLPASCILPHQPTQAPFTPAASSPHSRNGYNPCYYLFLDMNGFLFSSFLIMHSFSKPHMLLQGTYGIISELGRKVISLHVKNNRPPTPLHYTL